MCIDQRIISGLIFFLLTSSSLFAQEDKQNKLDLSDSKIDTLIELLDKHQKFDIHRVELQNKLGFEYWIVDPNQSERYGLQSIELSKMLDYPKGEAMANRVVGVSHWVRGSYELAFRFLFHSNSIYEALGDSLGFANTLLNLGMVYQDQSDYTKAESNYKKAIEIFSNLNVPSRVATTQTKWGSMLISMDRNDEAYEKIDYGFENPRNR